jgi:CCR4-NOT transcriptional regulation complex NOT5 subunit
LSLSFSHTGWCQRVKADFKFEYAFLEDELSLT